MTETAEHTTPDQATNEATEPMNDPEAGTEPDTEPGRPEDDTVMAGTEPVLPDESRPGPSDEPVAEAPESADRSDPEPVDGSAPVEAEQVEAEQVESAESAESVEAAEPDAEISEPSDQPDAAGEAVDVDVDAADAVTDAVTVAAEQASASEEPADPAEMSEPAEPLQPPLANPGELSGPIEAILLVVDEPITSMTLASVLERPEHVVDEALRAMAMGYDTERRGFDLREVAGGWRLYTREENAEIVEKFVLDGQQAKLTQAALETLAVVAYRQPVNRSRVSAIRGVNCDGVMRTLVSRGLVEEAGSDDESGALLYRTTSYFLEKLGLNSLEELPDLAPYLPDVDEIESQGA